MDVQSVDPKTVARAVQVLETSHKVKVVNSVTEKSLARMQAEHSKMNAVTLLFVVAVAHFAVCDNPADRDGERVPHECISIDTAIKRQEVHV